MATLKVCGKCGVDVSRGERYRDAAGAYVCAPCAQTFRKSRAVEGARQPEAPAVTAVAETAHDDGAFELDAAPKVERLMSPCPECGRPLDADVRLCVQCGYNKETGRVAQAIGDPPGMTKKERKDKKVATMTCVQCGYDLKGLKEAKCPECGTVNSKWRQKKVDSARDLKWMYLKPAIVTGVAGLLLMLASLLAYGPGVMLWSLVLLATASVIGFVGYYACSMMFIGFDEPIGVSFVRFCSVQALYYLVVGVLGMLPLTIFLMWPMRALLYVILLIWIMELDYEDAWSVAVVGFLLNVGVFFAIYAMAS